jgi:hypothetical protein
VGFHSRGFIGSNFDPHDNSEMQLRKTSLTNDKPKLDEAAQMMANQLEMNEQNLKIENLKLI